MSGTADPASLASCYASRAAEYERIYAKPERQGDLAALRVVVAEYFRDRRVLELARGTGYWPAVCAPAARAVVATDVGAEVLSLARAKPLPRDRVMLQTRRRLRPAGSGRHV